MSFTTLSESLIVPTRTSILNSSSPTYVHTCVIAAAPAATEGGDAANNEYMIQPRTMTAPSRQTAAKDLIKALPICEVYSPANAESGTGAMAA